MKRTPEELGIIDPDSKEDFNPISTLAVLMLLLLFVGASFYVLIDSYVSLAH